MNYNGGGVVSLFNCGVQAHFFGDGFWFLRALPCVTLLVRFLKFVRFSNGFASVLPRSSSRAGTPTMSNSSRSWVSKKLHTFVNKYTHVSTLVKC